MASTQPESNDGTSPEPGKEAKAAPEETNLKGDDNGTTTNAADKGSTHAGEGENLTKKNDQGSKDEGKVEDMAEDDAEKKADVSKEETDEKEEGKKDGPKKKTPAATETITGRPRRKASPAKSPAAKPSTPKAAPAKRKRAPAKKDKSSNEGDKKAKKAKTDPSLPKVDGRKKNKGSSKRESYSVAYKAKMVRDFDAWEEDQKKKGNENPSVREFVVSKGLGHKYENFLSKSSGWRSPKVRERIMQDSTVGDYQHMARMPDRSKNKSYYADMEEALLKRLEDCRAKNLTVTTKSIRELARQELRRLTNNDEKKVNAFRASNGWVYNFLKRQERKAKEAAMKQKREKAAQKKQEANDQEGGEKEGAATANQECVEADNIGTQEKGEGNVQPGTAEGDNANSANVEAGETPAVCDGGIAPVVI